MPRLLLIILFGFFGVKAFGLSDKYKWIFIKESDNISIYYRESDTLHYEELKFTTIYKSTPNEVLSIVSDVERLPQWSYICVGTEIIKVVSNKEWYYYYITETPWPLDNRDVVLHVTILQDSISGVITINSENFNGLLPEKEDYVRIVKLKSKYVLTPINENYVQVEFYFSTDPGGNIPLWVINSAISYGPIKTLTALKNIVENTSNLPTYK